MAIENGPGRTEATLIVRSLGAHALGTTQRQQLERRLVALYQQDEGSRDVVVAAFRQLAVNLAARYYRGREPKEDLEQVAMMGLMGALRRFDINRDSPFVAFAIPTIAGELRRHYRDHGWAVHVARGAQEMAQRVTQADRDSPRPLTVAEVAKMLGVTEEDVVAGRLASRAMLADSLDAPDSDGDDGSLYRIKGGAIEEGYEQAEDRVWLEELMRELPDREREIVRLRYQESLTQLEIGDRLGISQMHISRLLRRTLDTLRQAAGQQA